MINVFFDTEMTHLWEPVLAEPPGFISIGCISEDGQKFYAENAEYQDELCNCFVRETVLPLLDGGDVSMPYVILAKSLKSWIEGFDGEVSLWTDAPGFDWPHVVDLFKYHGWPANLLISPKPLAFASSIQHASFQEAVEDAFSSFQPALRRHHALDDAIANRHGFSLATAMKI